MSESPSVAPAEPTVSVFQGNLPLHEKLERARKELLDLSARNRLLNLPRSSRSARTIEIVDENSAEVFRLLVREGRRFSFVPGRESMPQEPTSEGSPVVEEEEVVRLAQPEDESLDERGILARHSDTKLQTRLTSHGLQKRLLDLYFDARTLEEEQGVNILFLALGMLKWIDPSNAANARYAPLILIPVSLERGTAGERFKLKWRQEDLASNLSLEAFLDRAYTLKLPPFESGDDFDPITYLTSVAEAVASKPDWAVLPDDIALGFFSFSKFLMYRDLDPNLWPEGAKLTELPLIRSLLADGFERQDDLLSDEIPIDRHILPSEMVHIVDSDSSQTLAVHDVRGGRNLVIQGPPGTGKSQTIANIVAAAVADGKTVLFVAEKMAALEVVKRRLDLAGVGDACLELHSNKANKRLLLGELRRTWDLGSPKGESAASLLERLTEARDLLNEHAALMNREHTVARLTPYQVIGELVRLRRENGKPADLQLEGPEAWSPEDRKDREGLLAELAQRIEEIGTPENHPWRGIGLEQILPTEVERLKVRLADLKSKLEAVAAGEAEVAGILDTSPPVSARDFLAVADLAHRIAGAPALSGSALGAPEWESRLGELASLLAAGFRYARLAEQLGATILPEAWTTRLDDALSQLAALPESFGLDGFSRLGRLHEVVPQLLNAAERLKALSGTDATLNTVATISRATAVAERVAAAPDASPEALASAVWDRGVEQATELGEAAARLEKARGALEGRVIDAAWTLDLAPARQTLAARGTSLFRFFSGEWRSANRLVKSVLISPDLPLSDVLSLLDQLASGKGALATLRNEDRFGQAAFGADWRGERSASTPLLALVEWVRSLRGLGSEPRLIASRMPDRSEIGEAAARVRKWLNEAGPLLEALINDLGSSSGAGFGQGTSGDRIALEEVEAFAQRLGEADALCRMTLKDVPARLADRLERLHKIVEAQRAGTEIENGEALGRSCFGAVWNGKASPWPEVQAAADWIAANGDIRLLAARLPDRTLPAAHAGTLQGDHSSLLSAAESLLTELQTDGAALFANRSLADVSTRVLTDRLTLWLEHSEQLSKWVAYQGRADRARTMGLGPLVRELETGSLAPARSLSTFEGAYFEALFAEMVRYQPALARFDGPLHSRRVREFVELDLQRIKAAQIEVVRSHFERIPPSTGGVGPLGILRGEMARRRGHMPIRLLMQKAAPAIQALKPVLMMSPLSVAQFLPPGLLTFDLLVMDEASQIQPVDALGAIARSRQVVVVGDERQLPPTRFFAKMTGGQGEEDDDEGAKVEDIESILGLFSARGLPQRMLRWHYRSRHQSLIAVSNSQFYESKLFIVPSPYTHEAGMGLLFHHIPTGVFDSGGSAVNVVEAKAVAEAILRHAKATPDQSLGVAAFSIRQRRAIQDQIELLRRLNPGTEPFFVAHPHEPFFVKNLENVQGDERDVIFISVGYGRNPEGSLAMRFGPLSAEGGERRLNVLISRAKRRCEVFSSITDEDIDLERAKGRGVVAFKLFLRFARTGNLALAAGPERPKEPVFEAQVAEALRDRDYQVHPRVGIAGFFIDLAVADPKQPERYLLGIECDGPSYRDSRSARDRDRLRRQVLEDHGWILHRVWSFDWFQRPSEGLERLVAAIEAARHELDARLELRESRQRGAQIEVITIERETATEIGLTESSSGAHPSPAYVEATVHPPSRHYELHDAPVSVLAQLAERIVEIEGPVHADEVIVRLRSAWGLLRTGPRIQSAGERAIAAAVGTGRLKQEDRFLSLPGAEIWVRDRSDVSSPTLRKPEMLPPAEIRSAILQTVKLNFGARPEEIVQTTSRLFGFKSTSAQLREAIQAQTQALTAQGRLVPQGELLVAAPQAG